MLNYKSAPKQTHKMMIYIYTPSIFTTTKNQTISRNFWRRYIFVFLSLLLLLNFLFSFFNYFFSSLFCPCHLITKVCESLLRYTCMNVVCKIEHIKKPWSLLQKKKKSPKIPPSIFFFFSFWHKEKLQLSCHIAVKFHDSHKHEGKKLKKDLSSPFFEGENIGFY